MKKILLITYYWPPSGGPGVQRVLKFAKYLPDFGYKPLILTVRYGEYPAMDKTLGKDIPAECRVYRTAILEPNNIYKFLTGKRSEHTIDHDIFSQKNRNILDKISKYIRLNIFLPDAKLGWYPFAVSKGKEIIKQQAPDIILSSSPPPTVHLIAKRLAGYSSLPWIADFRDPWTEMHYYKHTRSRFARRLDKRLEKSVIDAADHLICVSKHFLKLLPSKKQFSVIPNGFDEDDFNSITEVPEKFIITYMGTLNKNRFYREAFEKIKQFLDTTKDASSQTELHFIGSITPEITTYLKSLFQSCDAVHFQGYISHNKAVEKINNSSVLLLFLEKAEDYQGHIPGKLFEYLATGNYLLGMGEAGDARNIIESTRTGTITSDTEIFYEKLKKYYSEWKQGKTSRPDFQEINNYSRRKLTKKLATILDSLVEF